MDLINIIIVNVVLITFPILLYFFYTVYANVKGINNNDLYLSFTLIISLYLCFKFGDMVSNNIVLLFCNIPIVIAYVKKKWPIAVILSAVIILYSINVLHYNLYGVTTIKYISYAILYFVKYHKTKTRKINFINQIAILQGFFISFEYFIQNHTSSFINLFNIFIAVISIYTITFLILYIFKIGDDISKIYLSYKELQQDKQIKESLFKITHEIKNPIAVCKGYIDMFDINKKEESLKYISIIKSEIDRTLNILTDLSELNKVKITKDIVDINMIIEEIIDSVTLLFGDKNIVINCSELDEIYIDGDYNKLKQVFINIFKNCYEAINDNGIINIDTSIEDKMYIIKIKDNGMGMSSETLNKIGEIFYTTKRNGTGIGVALSKQIINAHNGKLEYTSQLGVGTTAIVKIPLLN